MKTLRIVLVLCIVSLCVAGLAQVGCTQEMTYEDVVQEMSEDCFFELWDTFERFIDLKDRYHDDYSPVLIEASNHLDDMRDSINLASGELGNLQTTLQAVSTADDGIPMLGYLLQAVEQKRSCMGFLRQANSDGDAAEELMDLYYEDDIELLRNLYQYSKPKTINLGEPSGGAHHIVPQSILETADEFWLEVYSDY